jgi:hypothetical protein
MNTLRNFLFTAAGVAALGLAAPAVAQEGKPFIGLAHQEQVAGPSVIGLADGQDGWLLNGVIVHIQPDDTNATGLISSGIADGTGIALMDHDTFGKEGGSGPSDSDYFYIFHNVVYWDSDSETSIPIASHLVDPSKFLHVFETGHYQDFSSYFGLGPGNTIAIFSDVPEPATWALMLVGFGGLGLAMRARRHAAMTDA